MGHHVRPWFALLALASLAGCLSPGGEGGAGPSPTVPPADDGSAPAPPTGDAPTATTAPGGAAGGGTGSTSGAPGDGDGAAGPAWAPLGSATIRPGVRVVSGGGQCTSNFLFTSPSAVYLGLAAHCVVDGDPNAAADGCDPVSEPMDIGTQLQVEGADHPGTLAYTSWGTMQARQESDGEACAYNDFALVALDPRDAAKANPAMLFFGGPTALAEPADVGMLDKVMTYGDSGLRGGQSALSPHEGYVMEAPGPAGWTTSIYTLPQGIPGDSGSGVLMADGQALGVLVTLSLVGGSNGVTTLDNALDYAAAAGTPATLATSDLLDQGNLPPP